MKTWGDDSVSGIMMLLHHRPVVCNKICCGIMSLDNDPVAVCHRCVGVMQRVLVLLKQQLEKIRLVLLKQQLEKILPQVWQ